jgi:pyruvate formate lyase activating enzyme
MKEAYCYKVLDSKDSNSESNNDQDLKSASVRCFACAHRCTIPVGKTGICQVRENIDGRLYSKVYDKVIAMHIDPIEKKPLYHFLPKSKAFSIGTVGCNFNCAFCQNCEISFADQKKIIGGKNVSPEQMVSLAVHNKCESIAYTYTEPTIFLELVHDTAKIAKEQGLKNVMVTNGYFTKEALDLLGKYIDAMNIDLKSFREEFYRRNCKATLAPVLESIKEVHKRKIWLEITTLIIEGENDSEDEIRNIAKFIAGIDKGIPWHISRFFPMHKMQNTPPTSINTLRCAWKIGKEEGLLHVYIGNV